MKSSMTNKGGLSNYYLVMVQSPQRKEQPPYQAECEDIIEALNLNFDEGNIFKEIWRTAAARQGNGKEGHTTLYGANKILHYAQRIHKQATASNSIELTPPLRGFGNTKG